MDDTKLHLGIEAGDVLLKVALYNPAEKKVVKTAVLNTESNLLDDVPSFEAILQSWLAENENVNIDTVSLTVPSYRAIMQQIFVSPEAKNIREYLEWYLGTIVNTGASDYILDFVELGGSAELGRTVLMIAMRKIWVDSIRKGFRNKQIAPKILEVDVLSVMNLMEVAGSLDGKLQCVIKADENGVMILWASQNDVRNVSYCPTFDLIGKSREDAYAILSKKLAEQIHQTEEVLNVSVDRCSLCGAIATDELFVQKLQQALEGKTLSLMESFENLRLPTDEEDSRHVLSCIGAIGVAMRSVK